MIPKKIKKIIKESDIILEVLDARIPLETRNEKIEKIINKYKKELILVINKSDLVPEDFAKKVKERFEYEYPTVFVSCKTRKGLRALRKAIKIYSPEKEKVLIGVVGYPNTGKSSLINSLVGRHRALTGSLPGITKGIQIIKLSRKFYLIDTPGVFPVENLEKAVIIGAIDPSKLEHPEKCCLLLLNKILEKYDNIKLYGIEIKDPIKFLENLSKKLNKNLRETCIKILLDWIKGNIKVYWI